MESGSCSAPYPISDAEYKAVRLQTAAGQTQKEEVRVKKTVSPLAFALSLPTDLFFLALYVSELVSDFVVIIGGKVESINFRLPSRRLHLTNDGRGPAAPSADSCPEQPDVCSGEAARTDGGDGNRLLHYENQKDKRRDPQT